MLKRNLLQVVFVFVFLSLMPSVLNAQSWEQEDPRFPIVNQLLRRYWAIKPNLQKESYSAEEKENLLRSVNDLKKSVAAIEESSSTEEGRIRLTYFRQALEKHITRLQSISPTTSPVPTSSVNLNLSKRTFQPGEEVNVSYNLPPELSGKIWIGLIPSTEPHRNIYYYSDDLSRYGHKVMRDNPKGVTYSAPRAGGSYDFRVFEMESGKEITSVSFRVNEPFIAELERYKKEMEDARKIFAARFEYDNIKVTYVKAFNAEGTGDWNGYSGSWSQNGFWLAYIEGNDDVGGVIYKRPLAILSDSIKNIKEKNYSYTPNDVSYFRNQMNYWRQRKEELTPLLNQLIELDALKNGVYRLHNLKNISDEERRNQELEINANQKEINGKINIIKRTPVFSYTIGTKPPVAPAPTETGWTVVSSENDNEGKEIDRVEKHTDGRVRTMTRLYFPGTRIVEQEVIITKSRDNSRVRLEERRDEQNRIVFNSNQFKNPAGVIIRGYKQEWIYQNPQDRQGTQKNYQYDPQTKTWKRF